MEQPGLEPGPIWEAGTAGKGLAIVPVPSRSAFKIFSDLTFLEYYYSKSRCVFLLVF